MVKKNGINKSPPEVIKKHYKENSFLIFGKEVFAAVAGECIAHTHIVGELIDNPCGDSRSVGKGLIEAGDYFVHLLQRLVVVRISA